MVDGSERELPEEEVLGSWREIEEKLVVPEVIEEGGVSRRKGPVDSAPRPSVLSPEMIREIRLQLGLSMDAFAKKVGLGVDVNRVYEWELGRKRPWKTLHLQRLAHLSAEALKAKLGVDINQIVGEGAVLRRRLQGRDEELKLAARYKMLGKVHMMLDRLDSGRVDKMSGSQLVLSIEKMLKGIREIESGGEPMDGWAEFYMKFGVRVNRGRVD